MAGILSLPVELRKTIIDYLCADQAANDFLHFDVEEPDWDEDLPVIIRGFLYNYEHEMLDLGVNGFKYGINLLTVNSEYHKELEDLLRPFFVLRIQCLDVRHEKLWGDGGIYYYRTRIPKKLNEGPENLALFLRSGENSTLDIYQHNPLREDMFENLRRLSATYIYPTNSSHHGSSESSVIFPETDPMWREISHILDISPKLEHFFILFHRDRSISCQTRGETQRRQSELTEFRHRLFWNLSREHCRYAYSWHDREADDIRWSQRVGHPPMQISWAPVSWIDVLAGSAHEQTYEEYQQEAVRGERPQYFEIAACDVRDPACPCRLYENCNKCTMEWVEKPKRKPVRVWIAWADEMRDEIASAMLEPKQWQISSNTVQVSSAI